MHGRDELHTGPQRSAKHLAGVVVGHHHGNGDVQAILIAHRHTQHAALVVCHDQPGSSSCEGVVCLINKRARSTGGDDETVRTWAWVSCVPAQLRGTRATALTGQPHPER